MPQKIIRKLMANQRGIERTKRQLAELLSPAIDDATECPGQEVAREGRLRRMAERRRMSLRASTCGQPDRYMLVDGVTEDVLVGGSPFRYSATLDDVARYLVG